MRRIWRTSTVLARFERLSVAIVECIGRRRQGRAEQKKD
jgi:hypothetical protein